MDDIKPRLPKPQPEESRPAPVESPPIVRDSSLPVAPGHPRFKKPLLIAAVLAVALLIAGLSLWSWYTNTLQPVDRHSETEKLIDIEMGLGPSSIGDLLEEEGVIRRADTFSWYVRREGVGVKLQAGSYLFSPNMSVPEIVDMLVSGKTATRMVQIPPGLRLDQLQERLVKAGFDKEEVETAFAASYPHPLLSSKPANASLEGYIFPDTYQVNFNADISVLMSQIFNNFDQKLTDEMEADLRAQGLSVYEAVTLASIIQKESSDPGVQRQIAQVFFKRLSISMPLGADATFLYAAAIDGNEPTVDYDSPYNTRIHAGLPPGPISNFNLSALEALANPAPGNYLYYVAGDDGKTHFSETLEEHEEKAAKYCHERCKL